MKTYTKWLAAALIAATVPLAPASAGGIIPAVPAVPESAMPVIPVQSNCNAVGQQVAAQQGGQLASASTRNVGGQQVCHIVIIVPAKDGERGRRVEMDVPQ